MKIMGGRNILGALQPLGRALMLPIAVLPIAGLLLRLGQPDLLDIAFVSAAGDAIFAHLGLLFAIGVATGFARDGNGAACLAGVVCFLVATEAAKVLLVVPNEVALRLTGPAADLAVAAWKAKAIARLDVPAGILSGLIGGLFYNRFSTIKLPEYLAFFGGRRFVPIVSGVAGLVLALAFGTGFATIAGGIDQLSYGIVRSGGAGLFLFGLLNRLLLVTGLHHLLNNIVWFVMGDYQGATGDLRRFFAGDPTAGAFMAGFFPVMMFGLPAACLAMYHTARPERRKAVGGMLASLALTAFLTGVTEPIEFTFIFLAPALYAIHAVLTGLAMVVMDLLGVRLGFTFSAGLFDYALNFGKATRPLLLIPVGLAYFGLYYGLFRFFIQRFDLKTPGREAAQGITSTTPAPASTDRGGAFLQALGGGANLTEVSACTTRLRLRIVSHDAIDDAALKALGALGIVRPSPTSLQVIVGPIADALASEIRVRIGPASAHGRNTDASFPPPSPSPSMASLCAPVLDVFGGPDNIASIRPTAGRLRVVVKASDKVDWAALEIAAPQGVRALTAHVFHLINREPSPDVA